MLIHIDDQEATTKYAAEIMSKLRPDIYTYDYALNVLRGWMNDLADKDFGYSISSGGFEIVKWPDGETTYSFELLLKLVDWAWFTESDGSVDFAGAIWKSEWVKSPIEEKA